MTPELFRLGGGHPLVVYNECPPLACVSRRTVRTARGKAAQYVATAAMESFSNMLAWYQWGAYPTACLMPVLFFWVVDPLGSWVVAVLSRSCASMQLTVQHGQHWRACLQACDVAQYVEGVEQRCAAVTVDLVHQCQVQNAHARNCLDLCRTETALVMLPAMVKTSSSCWKSSKPTYRLMCVCSCLGP